MLRVFSKYAAFSRCILHRLCLAEPCKLWKGSDMLQAGKFSLYTAGHVDH